MNHLTKLLAKLQKTKRNHSSKSSARKRFENRLCMERLEERSLMAVVAAWGAENTAVDSSVSGNHGTLYNGATYASGQIGTAFSFDGVNDRITVADSSSLKLTQSLSIEGWIKASAITTQDRGAIFFRGDDRNGLDPYQLTLEPGGSLIFQVQSLTETARMSSPMPLGQFVHVVATLDHATGSMRIYLNSVLMSEITTAVRPFANLDPASNPGIGIGNYGGYPASSLNSPFSGLIDELTVYNHGLSQAEVTAHFNAGKGSLQPTLSISDSSTTEGKPSIHFLDRFVKDASGGLNRPRQLTFGPDGNLFVADIVTSSILKYDGATGAPLGTFITPALGGLNVPGDLVFDTNGNLLVLGTSSNKLHKYDSNGAFLGIVASGLNAPYGIEKRSDGSFLIANSGTDQVLKVTGSAIGSSVTTFISAGSGGLNEPRNVVVGQDGDVYVVSQLTNSILKFDGSTGASKGVFAVSPTGGQSMWAEFGSDGALYASFRTEAICCNVTLARFNGTTGALEDSLNTGRDSWSFIMGPNNMIYNAGNGGGNYVDRFVITKSAAFTVSLNAPFPDTVSVTYATADGSAVAPNDYNMTSDTLTFLPGEFSKRVLVSILDDSEMEGTESFFVNLTSLVGIGATIADPQGVGTIFPPTKFYVVDDGSPDRTYEYGATGSAIENYSMQSTNTVPRGAATTAVGDKVWVVDANKKVYVYNNSGTLQGTGWTAGSLQSTSTASLQGITTNGADVWLVEDTFNNSKNDKIYRYKDAASRDSGSQNMFTSFLLNSANRNPTDLVTDGSSIWVLNNTLTTDSVFKYTALDNFPVPGKPAGTFLGSWTITGGGGSPTGITLDPSNTTMDMWIVDNSTRRVYQFDSARGRQSGSASPSSSFALAAGNTNPQGIADPPPPASMLASQVPTVALSKSIAEVEKPNRKILSSSDSFIAQVDSVFENWNEDSVSNQTKKRLAGRR